MNEIVLELNVLFSRNFKDTESRSDTLANNRDLSGVRS